MSGIIDISECQSLKDVDELMHCNLLAAVEPVDIMTAEGDLIPGKKAIQNPETRQVYHVASEQYTPLQNSTAFKWMEDIVKAGDGYFAQASLMNNEGTAWLSLHTTNMELKQQDGRTDTLENRLWALNDHGGKHSYLGGQLGFRLFCNNQVPTIGDHLLNKFSYRHTPTITDRVEMTTKLLKAANADWAETAPIFQHFAQKSMTDGEFKYMATALLDDINGPSINPETNEVTKGRQRSIDELETFFGTGNQGAGDTAWGALQSITGWIDHRLDIYKESGAHAKKITQSQLDRHFQNKIVGNTSRLKKKAVKVLQTFH